MQTKIEKVKIKGTPTIVGIAPNAWSRVVPDSFIENYLIICHKWRRETESIAKDLQVYSVQKELPEANLPKSNAKEILLRPEVQAFLKEKEQPVYLLVYKSTLGVFQLAEEHGWKVIGNPVEIKSKYENKMTFRQGLIDAGIEPIHGETLKFDDLNSEVFKKLQEKYGKKVVFQVAEMTVGGGTGTAFIETEHEMEEFIKRIGEKKETLTKIENVNAAKFITGIPASIPGCVTHNGIITGRIQSQVLDIPEVRSITEGNGLFCGHDWSFRQYNNDLQKQAKEIAKKFGSLLQKEGYKGIFGLDILVNEEEGKVYPIELNARYTDAFPLVSQMYVEKGILPLDYYHIMEFVGAPYEVNVDEVSMLYDQPLEGAQIILETKTKDWTKVTGDVKAGVYTITVNGQIQFKRDGYRYEHLQSSDEFLITEGVPFPDTIFKPNARIVRLVFKKAILARERQLTEEARIIISQVYEALKLVEISPQESSSDED